MKCSISSPIDLLQLNKFFKCISPAQQAEEWDRAHLIAFRTAPACGAHNAPVEADKLADLGVQKLFENTACIPHPELDWSFLND